jgi:acyl transferase domain-containing protein
VSFVPVAIVGRACLLPGARNPSELADLLFGGRVAITSAPRDRWGIGASRVMGTTSDTSGDRTWSDRGGYVEAKDLDASGFGIPEREVRALDPLYRWVLHVAREALRDAGPGVERARTGAILGNLSFPTAGLAAYAESIWLEGTPLATVPPDPRNRFSSGLPVHLLRRALDIGGPRFALDAACASSLYSVALACRALADGEADWMLAGAVNCADDLFIHVGFCALQAMSKTGQSRPFHAQADGLVPAEGCVMLVLRRLHDAVRDGDRILGVIRGVGLANDGRGRGLLSPHEDGQIRAMRQAWQVADLDPRLCGYVECHATGTTVGDATELKSLATVFSGRRARRAS